MALGAHAVSVNRARYQFLSRARLAGDQNGAVRARDPRHNVAHGTNLRTVAENLIRPFQFAHLFFEYGVFAQQRCVLACAEDGCADDIGNEGLGNKIERALAHALDGEFQCAHRGEEDDRCGRIIVLRGPKHVESASIRHLVISYHDVEILSPHEGNGFGRARCFNNDVRIPAQVHRENPAHAGLIINYQYFGHRRPLRSRPGRLGSGASS